MPLDLAYILFIKIHILFKIIGRMETISFWKEILPKTGREAKTNEKGQQSGCACDAQ